MSKRTLFQNFLVGNELIESRNEFKQAMLRGQLGLLIGVICIIYLILDPVFGVFGFATWYLIGLLVSGLVIYLNRIKKGVLSSVILLVFANIMVFLIADTGSINRGIFFFFMGSSAAGLVLFYQSDLRIGLAFVAVSLVLGIIANYNENPVLELIQDEETEYAQKINFSVNFFLGIFSSVLVVLFVIKRNQESEGSLLKSKEELEKLAEKLTEKNVELEKANQELDRFVYSASHDMRAPLATLQGLINVALATQKADEYPMYFNLMTNCIHDMEGFIKDVTDYSRNTRLQVENRSIKLVELLEELKEAFLFLASKASVKLEIDVDDDITIYTDPRRLKVVLNNLLANAIKYSDPVKRLRIVQILAKTEDRTCTIKIKDNGLGIEPEYQHKIFDMFYRASERSTGSGLGLYIAKETLQRLEGDISFSSAWHKGSTFVVSIPIGH